MIPRFRAWLKNEKEMIDVDEIHFDNGQLDFIGDAITFMREADEIELMQSTGLFDKNGQEIFEGDIIDTTDYEGGLSSVGNPFVKVERDKYGFVVIGDFPGSPITLKEFEHGRKFAGVEVTIAGNIYENPDLLEVIK